MGYRSDVKYKLLFKTEELRQTYIAKATLDLADVAYSNEIIESYDIGETKDMAYPYAITVHFNDVKWYDGDPWATEQVRLMRELGDTDGCGYVFMRIGEEIEDIETEDGGEEVHVWEYMQIVRYSEFF